MSPLRFQYGPVEVVVTATGNNCQRLFFLTGEQKQKSIYFFGCHATQTQYSSDSDPAARHHQGFSLLKLSAGLFPSSFFFLFCTLLGDLDLPASEVGLLDVLDAEVGVAL